MKDVGNDWGDGSDKPVDRLTGTPFEKNKSIKASEWALIKIMLAKLLNNDMTRLLDIYL